MMKKKTETEIFCEIREVFQIFDKDNDNYITKAEEQLIFEMFGIPIKESQEEENQNENKEQEEQEADPKSQLVEFNEFFDNIHQRLGEAESDENILESTPANEYEQRTEAEHIIKGIISPLFKDQKEQKVEGEQEPTIKRKNIYDGVLEEESRKIISDFGVYGTNDKNTYIKNLYKAMINKKY